MGQDFALLEEAAEISGLSVVTIKRLLQKREISGYKAVVDGRRRWLVSLRSLQACTDSERGFLLDRPGPKMYLKRQDQRFRG